MATRIDVPGTDTDLDLSDPLGAGASFVKLVVGFMIVGGAIMLAQMAWNRASDASPAVDRVEVL